MKHLTTTQLLYFLTLLQRDAATFGAPLYRTDGGATSTDIRALATPFLAELKTRKGQEKTAATIAAQLLTH